MKILVIDDSVNHLAAAAQTLVDHDVTLCATYDEALELLQPQCDKEKREKLLEKYKNSNMLKNEARRRSFRESLFSCWDAVLCDLLMPAGKAQQGPKGKHLIGQEMPVGWSLALTAALSGVNFVAVATDINHHNHPASAMIDMINEEIFEINSTKLFFTNHVRLVGIAGSEGICPKCEGTGETSIPEGRCFSCNEGVVFLRKGKDWGKILKQFTESDGE